MLISAKVLSNYRNGNVKGMVNDTTVHAEKSTYWASVSESPQCYCWMKCMSVCMYHTSTMTPHAITTTQVILKCLHAKFKTRAMNSHGDHSQTCLFNSYSNGGYHTTPWQGQPVSSIATAVGASTCQRERQVLSCHLMFAEHMACWTHGATSIQAICDQTVPMLCYASVYFLLVVHVNVHVLVSFCGLRLCYAQCTCSQCHAFLYIVI